MEPAKLGQIIKDITAKYDTDLSDGAGVNILASPDEFKSTYQILLELSEVWDKLTDTESAYLLEKIAGKHRATALQSILSNEETLIRAYETALDSAGSAMNEFEKRTESVEYHLNQLKATWQEVASDTVTTDFIIGVIDAAKAVLEFANNVGVLKIAFSGIGTILGLFANIKLVPYLEAQGKALGETQESVSFFGNEITVAGEKATKSSKVAAGAITTITTAVKALGKSFALGLAATALVTIFSKISDFFDEQKNKVNNLTSSINDLSTEISSLQNEYDELNSVDSKTDGEEQKLKLLQQQIKLKKEQLELQKQEKVNAVISDTSEYFDGYVTKTDFSDKMLEAENAIKKYEDSIRKQGNFADDLKERRKGLNELTEGTFWYSQALYGVKYAEDMYNDSVNVTTQAEIDANSALQALLPLREDLVYAVENSTGAKKEEAQANLDLFDSQYEELQISLGLIDTVETLSQKILDSTNRINTLNYVQEKATRTSKLTEEELNKLKEEYPELAEEVLKYATKVDDGYELEQQAIDALVDKYATYSNGSIEAQIAITNATIDECQKRIDAYLLETEGLKTLKEAYSAWETQQNTLGEYAYTSVGGSPYLSADYIQYQNDLRIIEESQEKLEELKKQANSKNNGGGGGSSGSAVDVWDEYANALAKAQEQVESFNAAVELTQAKLDFNQSKENRTTDLLVEEQKLYDELLEAQQARYKIVNDTLWLQQQQLKTTQQEVAEQLKARSPEYNISNLANWTQADVDRYIEFELDVDTNEADAKLANQLNYLLAMGESVDEYHKQWYELKQELADTKVAQLQVEIDWQNDTLDKFDEARGNAELLLDILGEMENTEEQRLELIEALSSTYDTEFGSTLAMHKTISDQLITMGEEGLQDTDEYNLAMKQRVALEEHALQTIQDQLALQKEQIETEKELAIKRIETSLYGEQGQDAWEKSRETEIERLQAQLDALNDDSSEADYLEDIAGKEKTIAQLEEKLRNLQQQRTIKQLKQEEDGSWQWEYVTDQRAIDETLAELEDAKNDLRKTQEEKALEDQKDAIQDRIDAIETEIEDKADQFALLSEQEELYYEEQKKRAEEAAAESIKILEERTVATVRALDDLERRTASGLNEVTEETEKGMEELSGAYSYWFGVMESDIISWVDEVIAEFERLRRAREAAEEEAAGMTGGASGASADGSYANGLKFVESNNFLARLHYGERVLTRQEAAQYNELEDDIKSGKLQAYFDSLKEDTVVSMSNVAANAVSRTTTIPTTTSTTTQFVIEHLELPEVKDPTDFAKVINDWARGEFGGMAQRARIIKAK